MGQTYPDIYSSSFNEELLGKREFRDTSQFCLQPHQKLLSNFINPLTQYSSLLVYHQPGLGKTLTAISIAEKFKKSYRIIVFVKNKILEANFKKELMYSCSNYVNSAEKEILLSNPSEVDYDAVKIKETLEKRVNKDINKHYTFYTYGGLYSDTPGNKPKNLSNCLVICDEIHNAIGNNIYTDLLGLLEKSSNFKIVLLTATPVFESISEIFEISNLLNIGQTRLLLPIRNQLITEKLAEKLPGENNVLNDSVLTLTNAGRSKLIQALKGKVSKLDIPENSSFAKKIFVGEKIIPGMDTILFKTKMSPLQEKTYSVFNKDDVLFKDSSDISTIVYPDGSFGKQGFEKYIKGNVVVDFLKKNELKNFSPKIHSVLQKLAEVKGPCFIYSNYVNFGGTELVAAALRSNGYSGNLSVTGKDKYFIFGEGISIQKRQRILRLFNSKKNINGDIIKVIIGSPAISEGVSFKNIRSIHVLEPHWNLSRINQIIGRGIRYLSHSNLPEKERTVKIFLHATVSSNQLESIDLLKYILSEKKDKAGKEVSKILQEISFDCPIHRKNISDYKCSTSIPNKVDNSTYSLLDHNSEAREYILNVIAKLFSKGFVYKTDFIIDNILKKHKGISVADISLVLKETVKTKRVIVNPFGVPGTLVREDDTISIIPNELEKVLIRKDFPKIYSPLKTKKNSPKKVNFIKDVSIFGMKSSDGVFRIVYNPENVKYEDNRKNKTGTVCSSYSKEILKKMVDTLGIALTKKETKDNLCSALEKYLIK